MIIPTTSLAIAEKKEDQTTSAGARETRKKTEDSTTSLLAAAHHHELVHHPTIVDVERVDVGRSPLIGEEGEVAVVVLLGFESQSSRWDGC